jgi:hypothetical protein
MANFSKEFQQVDFSDIGDTSANMKDSASKLLDSIVGEVANGVNITGDFIGLDIDKLEGMETAITKYVENLENHLGGIKTDVSTDDAFKGTYAGSVQEFVGAVAEVCKVITNQMTLFVGKLGEVRDSYNTLDANLKTAIDTDSSDIKSTFTSAVEG